MMKSRTNEDQNLVKEKSQSKPMTNEPTSTTGGLKMTDSDGTEVRRRNKKREQETNSGKQVKVIPTFSSKLSNKSSSLW